MSKSKMEIKNKIPKMAGKILLLVIKFLPFNLIYNLF